MRVRDSVLFLPVVGVFVALVFMAFARKFYLGWLFHSPQLPLLVTVHAAVMTGWVLLFMVQTVLVASRQVRLHQGLGKIGAGWGALVVIMGCVTTLHASAREVRAHSDVASLQLTITGLELTEMALFAGFVVAAVWMRRRGDYHKRLMLLTLVCMLPSVLPRLPLDYFQSVLSILLGVYAGLALCIGIDVALHRRFHPAFAIGGSIFALVLLSAFLGAQTLAWHDLLRGVVG